MIEGEDAAVFDAIRELFAVEAEAAPEQRALLVHNVREVIRQREQMGVLVPDDIYVRIAEEIYELGDYESTASLFDKVSADVLTPQQLFQSGVAYGIRGRYEEARARFESYLQQSITPRSEAAARSNLGLTYERLGRRTEAREQYELAIRADPSYSNTYNLLGIMEAREGHLDAAGRRFRRAISVNPDDADAHNNLAYLYAEQGRNLHEALAHVNEALERHPDYPQYLDTKGWILVKLDRHQEAVPLLEEAEQRMPGVAEIQEHLRQARAGAGG